MAGTLELVQVVFKLHVVVSELLDLRPALCRRFSFVFPIGQNVTSCNKKKEKNWKCHRSATVVNYWAMPVLTDESESKKSSFLSWLILDEVFCWLEAVLMCGFVCCWWNSNVSSLSNHCETLSNLSNLDDSSISTFFTINFVVRLLVSISNMRRRCDQTNYTFKNLQLRLISCWKLIFPKFCVSK